jgi:hypothetical protein
MKTIQKLSAVMLSITLCFLLGSFVANAADMPQYSIHLSTGLTVLAFVNQMPKGVLAMAAAPDLSALTAAFVKFGGDILRKNVNELDLGPGIMLLRNVKEPIAMPKLSAVGNVRPYSAADATTDGAKMTDRTLTVYQSKWDFDVDPENFRNTYLGDPSKTMPFYEYIIDQVGVELMGQINDNVLGSGVRSAAGTTAASLADGWITVAKAAVTALVLTPVAIGAITAADAVTKVETFAKAQASWMKKKGFTIRCSYQTFHDYTAHYRTLNGFGFQPRQNGSYFLDGFANVVLLPATWITTDGLLASVDNALAFGTDGDRITVAASMRRNISEVRLMFPVGCQISDLDSISVSDILVA